MAFGGITGKFTTNWTNDEILSTATAQSLGLSAGATPDEAFGALQPKIQYKIDYLTSTGTGTKSTTFPFKADIVWVTTLGDNYQDSNYQTSVLLPPSGKSVKLHVYYRSGTSLSETDFNVLWNTTQNKLYAYFPEISGSIRLYYVALKLS